jgi:hypothetical protein
MRQRRIVVLSDPADLLRASTLAQACGSPDFAAEAVTPAQLADSCACALVCWSRASIANADFIAAIAKIPPETILGVVLEAGIVPPSGQIIDLSRWRGSARADILSTVSDQAHEIARRGRRRFVIRRIAAAAGVIFGPFAVVAVIVGILGDGPAALERMCRVPGIHSMCQIAGSGGVATPEQDEDFRRAMAGGCSALARLVNEHPENPHSAEARRRVETASRLRIATWHPDEFEIAAPTSALDAISRDRAERLLTQEIATKAKIQCGGMPRKDQWRMIAADYRLGTRTCEQFSDGWRCSAPATLVCKRLTRRLQEVEDCSDAGLHRASLLSKIEGVWGEPGCAVSFRFLVNRQALLIESVRKPAGEAPYRAVSTIVSVSDNGIETRGEDFRAAVISYWTNGVAEQLTWDDGPDRPPGKLRRCG